MGNNVQILIKQVDPLLKEKAIDLAFTVEKAIASSFDIPTEISEKVSDLPNEYRSIITSSYQKALFKAFDSGYQAGASDSEKTKIEIPESLKQSVLSEFDDSISDFSEGKKFQIESDLTKAFKDGYEVNWSAEKNQEPTDENDQSSYQEIQEPKNKATAGNGYPSLQKSDHITQDDAIKHLEEYISKLDPKAQEIFRYELGIQYYSGQSMPEENKGRTTPIGMKVEASADEPVVADLPAVQLAEDTEMGRMIGPFAVAILCDKTINTVRAFKEEEDEEYYVLLENIITGTSKMSDEEMAEAISSSLEIEAEAKSLDEVKDKADDLAVELTEACRLPGYYLFVNNDNNYSLAFVFNKSAIRPVINAVEARLKKSEVTGSKLDIKTPQGALSTKIQKEIENFIGLSSVGNKSLKDLKRISPSIAGYVSRAISDYRNGKRTHKELASLLKADSRELVEMVFGRDGVGYYDYFTKS